MINKPEENEYHPFFVGYIGLVENEDLIPSLEKQQKDWRHLMESLSTEKQSYAYSEGKWTIKQLLRHVIDAERVFAYRLMCLARGEQVKLPGFSENDYIDNAKDEQNAFADLIVEFDLLRSSNISMIKSIHPDTLINKGNMNGTPTSTRAVVYMLYGHAQHHLNILNERYL